MNFTEQFQKYNLPILTNGVKLPIFIPTTGQFKEYNNGNKCSNYELLNILCQKGLEKRVLNKVNKDKLPEYNERLKYELKAIEEMGFTDYILMIWDICEFGDKNNIPRGPGRGSVCGSLLCYLIGITEIDAVLHETMFARFLNKARTKVKIIDGIKYIDGSLACDIDQDQCYFRRGEIISYINNRYEGKTSKLLSTSTLSSKILIKDVSKGYGNFTEDEANHVSNLLEKQYGIPQSIKEALEKNEEFKEWAKNNVEICNISLKLSNLMRGFGQHASAILISADKIRDIIPLQLSNTKEVISGYDMYSAQELSLKIDELGLKTVSHINACCKLIGITPQDIDINHLSIYEYLQNFEYPHGIFQFESDAQGQIAKKIRCKNLDQITDALSISRPGASNFLGQYLDYIHDGKYNNIHPLIDQVLKSTGGVCLFQEQFLKMLNVLGMELESCELIRRAIGKKDAKAIQDSKEKLYKLCADNNHPIKVADLIWSIAENSIGYQFNKSHSCAYAFLVAQTVYLKANYPKEFFLTLLQMSNEESDKHEIIATIKKEMDTLGIKLKSPHILHSGIDYKIYNGDIIMGLSSVKNISEKAILHLKDFQNQYSSKLDVFRAADLCKLNAAVMSSLILVGSLDDVLTESRAKTVAEYNIWRLLKQREKDWATKLGPEYNYNLIEIVKALNEKVCGDNGKFIIKDSRRGTIRKDFAVFLEQYNFNKRHEQLANWYFERALLGFSYSTNLYDIYKSKVDNLTTLNEINTGLEDEKVKFVAEVTESKAATSKNGNPYLKLMVKDHTNSSKVMIFGGKSNKLDQCKEMNNGRFPGEGAIIIVEGTKKDGNCIFADKITAQNIEVFLKISQLPKDKLNEQTTN